MCASNGIRAQYRYDRNDMQTEVLYGNGLRTSYTYDERSQLTEMETVLPGMSNPLFRGTYAYDANGCRITKTEQIRMDATTPLKVMETCYTYDSMERLIKESLNGAVTSYGYDLAGNRITKSTDGRTERYLYNNRNQLTELHREKDVVRYSYDPAGNLTEENYLTADGASTQKLRYAYDVYNRNVSVTGDDFTQKNHYDAEGYRDSITEKDKVTNFVYQGGMLLHELDEDKNPARHYVLGNEYIGLDHNYYLTDEQGSVRYVLDAAGNVQNDYRYDAFGQCIAGHENIPNRLRYNAQIEDDLTGLYYLRARYYNTGIGRFTQEDVIYNDGLNLYAYCGSNPVMYADPSGYAKKIVPFIMGEYDYTDINSIDYGKILKDTIGGPPSDMYKPHAHHVIFKIGNGKKQKALVKEAQQILVNFNIDPIKGPEVLGWAPNAVKGQHSYKTLKQTVDEIKKVVENGGNREDIVRVLEKEKQKAANRSKGSSSCLKK